MDRELDNREPDFTAKDSPVGRSERVAASLLAAAIGDALGWPQEVYSRSSRAAVPVGTYDIPASAGFRQWLRRTGGQYYPHDEVIFPGEYSDDTQLVLCTARSTLKGSAWLDYFTQVELPTWTLYERGAGRSVKRSAEHWSNGRAPWSPRNKPGERQKYFDAGGNGAAMRIMPHCAINANGNSFTSTSIDIIRNAFCTHGHPRAVIGSLAYGFALWTAYRLTGTLEYGELIDQVIDYGRTWLMPPMFEGVWPEWSKDALGADRADYELLWLRCYDEMMDLLQAAKLAMRSGAMAIDREVLASFGCFNPNTRGAGTVSSAAAIFLASRYAADPWHGLLEAAFASGADTDTLASMAGGLLGAINGTYWLNEYVGKLQDVHYIASTAAALTRVDVSKIGAGTFSRVTKAVAESFKNNLHVLQSGRQITLPDRRTAIKVASVTHASGMRSFNAISYKLDVVDGQVIYIKAITRTPKVSQDDVMTAPDGVNTGIASAKVARSVVLRTGIRLPVSNIGRSREFYETVFRLPVEQHNGGLPNIMRTIVLDPSIVISDEMVLRAMAGTPISGPIVFIETTNIQELYEHIQRLRAPIVDALRDEGGRRYFRSADPDGNIFEFFERI